MICYYEISYVYYELYIFNKLSAFVDIHIADILNHISSTVLSAVNDPKDIQGDINLLPFADRLKISVRASQDYKKALEAREYERNKDFKSSINKWSEIFGPDFPLYY